MNATVLHGDCIEQMRGLADASVDSIVTDPPYLISFMGKDWDSADGIAGKVDVWREALRVLKPGGHLLAFSATRTQHRVACAIEDAGFEIRDQIYWHYGTGFPKSLNVSKKLEEIGSPCAAKWSGFGTALKPASEPICVARKPLIGTVAANVLEHGTGALNIDGCRIDGRERTDYGLANAKRSQGAVYGAPTESADFDASKGRWPANVIHDGSDEVMEAFAAFGERKNGGPNYKGGDRQSMFGNAKVVNPTKYAGDTGTAARFFYSAKASKADRAGSKHPTVKPLSLMRYLCKLVTPPGGTVLDPFAGSGTTLQAAVEEGFSAIGIEREAEYHADILQRLEMARKAAEKPAPKSKAIRVAKPKKPANADYPTLFDLMVCESA